MKAKLFVLILILGLITTASAQVGRLAGGLLPGGLNSDITRPDPILADWGLRDVNWTQIQDALHPFSLAGAGVLGNYLYVFDTNTGQAFNITTELWEESTPAPLARWDWAGVATESAVYLIGGYNGGDQWDVQRFTPTGSGPTGTWTQMAHYPFVARGIAAAWDGGNYIYAAGGYSEQAFKYDIAMNVWTEIAPMPGSRGFAGGAFVLGKLYVLGGFAYSAQTWEYDPGSNTWQTKAYMPQYVFLGTFCTTFNDSLIFTVGGGDAPDGTPPSNEVQIYNPLTDAWYVETPLPVPVSQNIARWIGGGVIISAGGCIGSSWVMQDTTWKGVGFPTGSLSYNLSVTLVPFTQPIQIPASGGSFSYYAFATNNDATNHTVQLWTKIIDPTGSVIGPCMGPAMVTLPPGTRGWVRHQNIPGEWIPGLYTYIACAGIYPGTVYASDSLQFTKSTTGDGPRVSDWSCTGEEIGDTETTLITHNSSLITSVMPNPFNPSTAISYQLSAASHVSLRIFDTAGRLVTELIKGWRDAGAHEVTFDGSGLASGIYVYRLEAGQYTASGKMVLMK